MSLIQDALKKVQGDPLLRSPLDENRVDSAGFGRGRLPWQLIGIGVAGAAVLFLAMKLPGVLLGGTPAEKPRPSPTASQRPKREPTTSHAASVPTPSRRVATAASGSSTVAAKPRPPQPASAGAATASKIQQAEKAIPEPARAEQPDDEFALTPPRVEETLVPVPETQADPFPAGAMEMPVLEGKDRYYFNMGLFFQEQDQYTRAFEAYQKTVELNPFHAEAYNNLGVLYKEVGELNKAIQHFRKALAVDPEYVKAYNNLGVALIALGELEEAQVHFERALSLNPRNVESYTNLGVIYRRRHMIPKAIRTLEAALSLDPDHPETHYNLALLMEEQGRIAEAVAHYRKFLVNAHPHHRSVVAPVITRIRQLTQKTAEFSTPKFPQK